MLDPDVYYAGQLTEAARKLEQADLLLAVVGY